MAGYVDPLAVTRTTGPDLAVTPSAAPFDPNNPLGLTAAAPGYLPPELRPGKVDPDLGITPGGNMYMGPALAQPTLSPDEINAQNAAEKAWADMDQKYYAAREQNPLPLVLGAAGLIAAPFALSALGLGGAAAAGGGAAASGAGTAAAAGGLGALGAGTAAAGAGATVSELVVTAAAQGLSIPAIAASIGIPAATVSSILSSSGGSNALSGGSGTDNIPATPAPVDTGVTVSPLTVTPAATPSALPAALGAGALGVGALAAGAGGGGGGGLGDYVGAGVDQGVPAATGPNAALGDTPLGNSTPTSLMNAIKSGDPSQIGSWIAANPLQALQLGLLSASALSTVTGGAKPSGSSNGTYTPVPLPASFSATSPHFALAGRGDPRLMPAQDWTKYGQGPEQSFFTGISQPAPIHSLAVSPMVVPDRIGPKTTGYAKGGFAVRGEGDGRSDSIDAKLSDGEYVFDAESVALLGNGSNRAGADKLDQFRVNLRKDKGRNLARGDFSVHAKDPASYMGAR